MLAILQSTSSSSVSSTHRRCYRNTLVQYQHQNTHKLRHNGQNESVCSEAVAGEGGGGGGGGQGKEKKRRWMGRRVHFSIHSCPSLTYSMALKSLQSVAVLALRALFMDHGLFTIKPSASPEEMWAQDVLSLVRARFN